MPCHAMRRTEVNKTPPPARNNIKNYFKKETIWLSERENRPNTSARGPAKCRTINREVRPIMSRLV